MSDSSPLEQAHAAALRRWQAPFPGFTSGQDPRTSDNALLVLTYGGVDRAARHAWLNAGRRLVDKTYVEILRHVQGLTGMQTWRAEPIAAALDDFIRGRIATRWSELPRMGRAERAALAIDRVETAARELFGSLPSEPAAGRLLFFLCPMLSLFNLSRGHLLAVARLGHAAAGDDYRAYTAAVGRAYLERIETLRALPRPAPVFGDPAQWRLVQHLLDHTDWWERRVFDQLLHRTAHEAGIDPGLFGSDDTGQVLR